MSFFPLEIWEQIIRSVDEFESVVALSRTNSTLRRLVYDNDRHLARAVKQLDRCIWRIPDEYDQEPLADGQCGKWMAAGLSFKRVHRNVRNGVQGRIVYVEDGGYIEGRTIDLREVPVGFGPIAIVAGYPIAKKYNPRSQLACAKNKVAFRVEQMPVVVDFGDGSAERMVNCKDDSPQDYLPDFEHCDEGMTLRELDLCGDCRTYDLSPIIHRNTDRHGANFSHLNGDDDLLIHQGTDLDQLCYVVSGIRAQRHDVQWRVRIPIERDISGVANILVTNDLVLVLQKTLRVYDTSGKCLVSCPMPDFGFMGYSNGLFATTQTHLFVINGLKIQAIRISEVIEHGDASLDRWHLVLNLRDAGQLLRESLRFSARRFFGHYVAISSIKGLCLIDLIKGNAVFFTFELSELGRRPLPMRVYCLREESRYNVDHWIVDATGKVVYLPTTKLWDLCEQLNTSGRASLKTGTPNTFQL